MRSAVLIGILGLYQFPRPARNLGVCLNGRTTCRRVVSMARQMVAAPPPGSSDQARGRSVRRRGRRPVPPSPHHGAAPWPPRRDRGQGRRPGRAGMMHSERKSLENRDAAFDSRHGRAQIWPLLPDNIGAHYAGPAIWAGRQVLDCRQIVAPTSNSDHDPKVKCFFWRHRQQIKAEPIRLRADCHQCLLFGVTERSAPSVSTRRAISGGGGLILCEDRLASS